MTDDNKRNIDTGLPPFVIPDCLGVNIHFIGREQKQVDQIARAGFRFTRMDFFWHNIEKTRGEYDFQAYDELVETLASRDVRTIFILDYNNKFYDNGVSPYTDEGRFAFAAFAKAAAAHFRGKGVLWEIWNEPNLTQFWHPAANVEDYVKLAKVVYPALKEGDPDCTVLAPALSGWDYDFLESAFKLGLLECTDVVSLHAYGARIPDDAAHYYSAVRRLIAKYSPKGRSYPIISGEWGYSSCHGLSVEGQAEFLVREFLTNTMSGCRLSIWYDWHDDGPDPDENEHHFGTVFLDFTEKPAYLAMQTLVNELRGYSFTVRLALDSDQDYLAVFRNGDDYRIAAWTTGEPHTVSIPMDGEAVEVVSLLGERESIVVGSGAIDLELTGAVQYIEPEGRSKRLALESKFDVIAKTFYENGMLKLKARCDFSCILIAGKFTASIDDEVCVREYISPDTTSLECKVPYVSSGEQRSFLKAVLAVKDVDIPLVRRVEIDTTACPGIEVFPPGVNDLIIAVNRPMAGFDGAFRGMLEITYPDGLKPALNSVPFELAPDQDQAIVRIPLSETIDGNFGFGVKLVSDRGDDLLITPVRRYAIVETFACDKIGSEITGYELKIHGDDNVRAEVRLTCSEAPAGAPNPACARLDYDFDAGHRYVRIVPRSDRPIEGKPRSARVWVYGNGGDSAARLLIIDAGGQTFQPDFGALLSFTGWRSLEGLLTGERAGHCGGANDGILRYPISWSTIFLFDNMGKRKTQGTIYIGPVILCYDK